MNILIFSDTHLYLPFDQKKFVYLKKIISSSDWVIINGDFFDGYMIKFKDFISSPWNQLFPLLKSKKAVYLYGNHDKRIFSDRDVDRFSDIQVDRYKLKTKNKVFIFEHGQKIRATPDTSLTINWEFIHLAVKIGHYFRHLMIKLFGKLFITLRFAYRNINCKRKINEIYQPKDNEIYIIGHNHYGEVDEKNHYAASGMILYGFAQYLTIENEKISLHEEWYEK
jgi:predicted phosphodiesterase